MSKIDIIQIEHLSVNLEGFEMLSDVTVSIDCREVTAIIGPNGAGKTSLLLAILGLVPYQGKIRFLKNGRSLPHRPKMGYVPQVMDFDREAPLTVLDFLLLNRQAKPLWLGYHPFRKKEVLGDLERLNADHLATRLLGKLSGGELQRVLLCMALQDNPDLILLDEPISGVDIAGEELFCDMLDKIQKEARFSLIFVSHDLSVVTHHAQRVVCLNRTVKCEGRTLEVLTPENIASVYGLHASLYKHNRSGGH